MAVSRRFKSRRRRKLELARDAMRRMPKLKTGQAFTRTLPVRAEISD